MNPIHLFLPIERPHINRGFRERNYACPVALALKDYFVGYRPDVDGEGVLFYRPKQCYYRAPEALLDAHTQQRIKCFDGWRARRALFPEFTAHLLFLPSEWAKFGLELPPNLRVQLPQDLNRIRIDQP